MEALDTIFDWVLNISIIDKSVVTFAQSIIFKSLCLQTIVVLFL